MHGAMQTERPHREKSSLITSLKMSQATQEAQMSETTVSEATYQLPSDFGMPAKGFERVSFVFRPSENPTCAYN